MYYTRNIIVKILHISTIQYSGKNVSAEYIILEYELPQVSTGWRYYTAQT